MWENEGKKTLIRNIIIFLLLTVVVAVLLVAMLAVKKQIDAEDELLKAQSSNQQQELSVERQENLDSIQQAYDKDMQTVQTYLPGIICWGDSLTAGSSGNVSYPGTLQKYINTYMCDIYEFYSTIDNAQDYSRLDWSQYTVSIPVVNMGSGKENCATVLGRSGVSPYVVGKQFEIPGETEAVTITIKSQDGQTVAPLTAGNVGVNPVVLSGVEGTITLVSEGQGTEIITAATGEYTDYVHIVWIGTYDDVKTPDSLVASVKQLLSRQAQNPDRYLVLGPCTIKGSWSGVSASTMNAIDSAMLQEFGNHYINVRKYLMGDGMTDAGLSVSREEKSQIQQGQIPASFRSNTNGADLSGTAYKLLGKLVYDRMESLGYFAEVRQELGLDKTTQDILKTNPRYFENILNAK